MTQIYSDAQTNKEDDKYGYLVVDEKGRVLESRWFKGWLGNATIATAEALGVEAALRFCPMGGFVRTDSLDVVKWVRRYKHGVKNIANKKLRETISRISRQSQSQNIQITYCPRYLNLAGLKRAQQLRGIINDKKYVQALEPVDKQN